MTEIVTCSYIYLPRMVTHIFENGTFTWKSFNILHNWYVFCKLCISFKLISIILDLLTAVFVNWLSVENISLIASWKWVGVSRQSLPVHILTPAESCNKTFFISSGYGFLTLNLTSRKKWHSRRWIKSMSDLANWQKSPDWPLLKFQLLWKFWWR